MAKEKPEQEPERVPLPEVGWADFLTSSPPSTMASISDLTSKSSIGLTPSHLAMRTPDLVLHCASEVCQGDRVFAFTGSAPSLPFRQWDQLFLRYVCRNCRQRGKTFAVDMNASGTGEGIAIKVGEWPPFGPPTPARLISLIGPDRDLFLSGRRSENQGLGIGAFAYYRRVVENQKNRLLDEIIRVSRQVGAKADKIALLESAKQENQFSKAVDMVKDAIPESLLIQGHNPFTLLHKALSQGLHAESDEECQTAASAIRVVLAALSERIGEVLKDDAELQRSVSRLLQGKNETGRSEG